MYQEVYAVIINNEFSDNYFTDEKKLKEEIESLRLVGEEAKATILPKHHLDAILKIQKLAGVFPDFNTIILEVGNLNDQIADGFYKMVNDIDERAYAKEYFDYLVENKLQLSDDPNFNPDMAAYGLTMTYKDYLIRQVDFLKEIIESL